MQIKVESGGWPDECKNNPEKKAKYLKDYADIGIVLNPTVLDDGVNEGMRFIAKQFLNSLWGRWGLRLNLDKHVVIDVDKNFKAWRDIVFDDTLLVNTTVEINENKHLLVYRKKEGFEQSHPSSSIFVASRTTYDRHLRKFIQKF